jgi:hypothetical protein
MFRWIAIIFITLFLNWFIPILGKLLSGGEGGPGVLGIVRFIVIFALVYWFFPGRKS